MILSNKYDRVITGILIGICVPFASYGILLVIYDQLDHWGVFNPLGMSSNFRERTIALLALICNIIPLHLFNKYFFLNAMRGIVFPTLIYVILWMYFYGLDLFQ